MLVLLRRTSFLTTFYSLYFLSVHTYYILTHGPLRAASMYCINSCLSDLWGLLIVFCLHVFVGFFILAISDSPPVAPWVDNILIFIFWCSSMVMWMVTSVRGEESSERLRGEFDPSWRDQDCILSCRLHDFSWLYTSPVSIWCNFCEWP